MASTVDICNGAMQLLGERLIVSLTENSKAARECNASWDRIRRATIRLQPWNSTTTRKTIPKLTTVPAYDWDVEYQLPSDCLAVFEIDGADSSDEWRIEGRKLLCDLGAPLGIMYGRDESDSQIVDPLLVEVLSMTMAVELCETLTQSNSKEEKIQRKLDKTLAAAARVDGREQTPGKFEEDQWLLARWRR